MNISEKKLPHGWATKDGNFVHPCIEGENFKNPFPLSTSITAQNPDLWSPLLPLRITKSTMYLATACSQPAVDLNFQTCLRTELQDRSGVRTGVIESMLMTEAESPNTTRVDHASWSPYRQHVPGEGKKNTNNIHRFKYSGKWMNFLSSKKQRTTIFTISWIEWEDGIAYRKTLGRVFKEAWDKQDPEENGIVLYVSRNEKSPSKQSAAHSLHGLL